MYIYYNDKLHRFHAYTASLTPPGSDLAGSRTILAWEIPWVTKREPSQMCDRLTMVLILWSSV